MYPQNYELAKTHQADLRQEVAAGRLARQLAPVGRGTLWQPATMLSRGLRLVTRLQAGVVA